MAFPKRFTRARCPQYDEAVFRLLANPDGKLYGDLLSGDASSDDAKQTLGAALQEAYGGETIEAYGVVFDFSTPDAAMKTILNEDIPVDLRAWLRNAPLDIVTYEREQITKNFRASLVPGN